MKNGDHLKVILPCSHLIRAQRRSRKNERVKSRWYSYNLLWDARSRVRIPRTMKFFQAILHFEISR